MEENCTLYGYVLEENHTFYGYVLEEKMVEKYLLNSKKQYLCNRFQNKVPMYNRDLLSDLRDWKRKTSRKPLVLRGARQVGKTTLVDEFSHEFDCYIKLNLEKKSDRDIFERTDNVKEIIQYLYVRENIALHETQAVLLFIDEIQESYSAVSLLRYFYEEAPDLYVIAAGSRLQKLLKHRQNDQQLAKRSFPVGRVEYLNLRPFSFLEYLSAAGKQTWREQIENLTVSELLHVDLQREFNTFALIGGMPEVVSHYLTYHDLVTLAPIYKSLITGYIEDVENYATNETQTRVIRHILNTGWHEGGSTIKFANFGNSTYTSTQIHEAMDVLSKAFIMQLAYPITSSQVPAIPIRRRSPKLIWMDNGLVNHKVGLAQEYLQNKNLLDTWRGRAAEHIVAQELQILLDKHIEDELCFWVRDKKGANAEIDFIWQKDGRIYPIEVKSGHNSKLQSLQVFVDNTDLPVTAIRFWNEPFSINDLTTPIGHKLYRLVNVPFYSIGMLEKIIDNCKNN